MKCATCGNMLSPASTYCAACGTSNPPPPAPASTAANQSVGEQSGQPEITPYGNNQPLRAQSVFYGRYGMRGGMTLPQPSSLTPSAGPTQASSAGNTLTQPTTSGPQPEPTTASISAPSASAGASSKPAAMMVASPPEAEFHNVTALPPARPRPVTGRLLVLGATILLIALIIGLGTSGYQVYKKSQTAAHSTATADARAQATATAIAQASATARAPLFIDPLVSDSNGWMIDGKTSFFEDGQYHLHNPDPTMTLNSYYEQQGFEDFKIQVTVTAYTDANPNADVTYAYGLILRADPSMPGDKYVFFVSPAGTYDFERHDVYGYYNNGWTDLLPVPWASSSAIKTGKGAVNTLAVLASGSTFILFINGQEIVTITDPGGAFGSGWIGLMVQGADMEAGFSNLRVYGPGT